MEQQIKIIAHRGNLNGPNPHLENKPSYIEEALNNKYDVEIDVWYYDKKLWSGHDCPKYRITKKWLANISYRIWIHCKNIDVITKLLKHDYFNLFGHLNDDFVLTSNGNIFCKPGFPSNKNTIMVMPEISPVYVLEDFNNCCGICTDYPTEIKNKQFGRFCQVIL